MKESASRSCKLAGLKSVRHLEQLSGFKCCTLHKYFKNDREMFNALLAKYTQRV